jgi:hypothetical protein
MCTDHGNHDIPLPPLSDEAAVEILDFLQAFTLNFENRYAGQIRRYYDERSYENIRQYHSTTHADDPPF